MPALDRHELAGAAEALLTRLALLQGSVLPCADNPDTPSLLARAAADLLAETAAALRFDDPNGAGLIAADFGGPAPLLELCAAAAEAAAEATAEAAAEATAEATAEAAAGTAAGSGGPQTEHDARGSVLAVSVPGLRGGLAVGSPSGRRRYTAAEQAALQVLAAHVGLLCAAWSARNTAEQADRDRELVLSMLVHDLRAPLTVVVGILHTLHQRSDVLTAAQVAEFVEAAHRRAGEVAALTDRLLEGSDAVLVGAPRAVAVASLVRDVVRGADRLWDVRVTDLVDAAVFADPTAVRVVLQTLLDNAIRYCSPNTTVTVDARADGEWVDMRIRNVGSLPLNAEGAMPDRRDQGAHGAGLGLYIAERLTRAMGGRLQAQAIDNTVDVSVRLPAHHAAAEHL